MGSCLSCKYAGGSKTRNPPCQPVLKEVASEDPSCVSSHSDKNSNKNSRTSQHSLSANDGPKRPTSGLETGRGREKKLSICSTYSDRPLHDLPSEVPEDNALTVHDFYNIINDGALNPYIHEDGNFLIIDCRSEEVFSKLHVITARHFAELKTDSKFMSGLGYSLYNIVIIYGNGFKKADSEHLVNMWREISLNVAGDVLVLSEGFDQFKERFSFMCTKNMVNTIWERKNILTYPSVVINGKLYQGKGEQATSVRVVKDLKITHIVNITKEHPNAFPDKISYLKLPIDDERASNLLKHFEETSEFMEAAFKMKGVVLVHCNLGVSRSSSVVLAYLMKSQQISLEKALQFLKSRRSCARPNIGFLTQLSQWELKILGEKVTCVDSL